MKALLALFGKSPFRPLQDHMEKAQACVEQLVPLFDAVSAGDAKTLKTAVDEICRLESEADVIKNDIRSHLPKSMFLPVDRRDLLEILYLQDLIADRCEDIAVSLTLRTATLLPALKGPVDKLLAAVTKSCRGAGAVMEQMDELQETGFGGAEAEKVLGMIDAINADETTADDCGVALARQLFSLEGKLGPVDVVLWYQAFRELGKLADLAEGIGNRLRLLLAK
jgi:predicted phosphate transport protein (TIGR00153 family)